MIVDLGLHSMEELVKLKTRLENEIMRRGSLSLNGRLSLKKALHEKTTKEKPKRLEKYADVINHPNFSEYLNSLRPAPRNIIKDYLKDDATFQTVSLDRNLCPAEVQRYFAAGMKKIRSLIEAGTV